MPSDRLKVIVTRRLPEAVEKRLTELFDVTLREEDTPLSRADLVAAVHEADVLVPTITDTIDAGLLRQRGILVANTSGVVTEDTADMAMALIMAVTRRIPEGLALIASGDWQGWAPTALMGGRLGGRRLGILGMGRIGLAVARRARAFGMQIHYHNRRQLRSEIEQEVEATYWESLDQMVARMDIISINCPHTPATFHLMNARRLKLIKPDAVIVNTSRGEVIDENALTRMLRSGQLAGAGLDVYEHGARINPRLQAMNNVVMLPHMGSATVEGRIEMGEKVIINIKTFADGHRPPDQVVPAML
jgi:glyoxylate reductase